MAKSGGKSTKAKRRGVRELVRLYSVRDPADLMWFHAVGWSLRQLERREVGLSRKGTIRAAAEKLPGTLALATRINELTAARQFAEHYPHRTVVKELVARAGQQSMKFGVTHVRYLGSIANPKKRRSFVERCFRDKWRGSRLRAEIKRDRGHAKTGGRPMAAPATRNEGLLNLLKHSDTWLQRSENIWFGGPRPVIGESDQSEKPKDVVRLLRDAQGRLRQMAKAIKVAIPKLAAAERQAKRRHRTATKAKGTKSRPSRRSSL